MRGHECVRGGDIVVVVRPRGGGAEWSAGRGRGRAESDGYLYTAGGGPAVSMCRPAPAPAPPDVDSGVDKCYVNVRHFSISCHTQLQLHYSTSVCFYIYTSVPPSIFTGKCS